MIKINLLNSVTERQPGAVETVDRKIGNPATRLALTSITVLFLLLAVVGWEIISTRMAKEQAQNDLTEQQRIAEELKAVMAEQQDLEQKIQNIDSRIDAIKTLRASQAGPSAVLEAMRERIAVTPGIYLESVEQKGDQLEFKGNTTDEEQVTQFGRSLEFSNGLFSNLNIETKREEITNMQASAKTGGETPKVNIVNFTIKCAYTPSKAVGANNGLPTNASATAPAQTATPAPVQIAKN